MLKRKDLCLYSLSIVENLLFISSRVGCKDCFQCSAYHKDKRHGEINTSTDNSKAVSLFYLLSEDTCYPLEF